MNLTKLSALALSIALLSLSSCENHQLAPSAPLPSSEVRASETAGFSTDDIIVTVAKKHTLVKHGTATLAYDAAGKLVKVTDGNRTTTYTHSAGKIGVLTLVSGVKTEEGNYYLDANGRCTHSDVAGFTVEYGIPVKTLNWFKYDYDAKGRLAKRYHDIYPNMRVEFAYNADGDLTEVKEFDNPNNVIQKNTYEYQYAGSSILTDNNRLNATEVVKLDPYLRIFGKTSKHLVRRLKINRPVYNGINNDYRFGYTMNADGYPTVAQKYNVSNGALLQTSIFEYVVSDLTMMP
ncbi:DUF4595 domain-containing protein [Larkinella rosea]|uniref:DUF4595 domain-containing protein n=1 Tax=Larkinella rosea TaxID=2025312 RepID=A0A3P1BUU2_9BACT|nr:DUF4595 domain-containing protein [Larkinella rosea]RRB04881.1 DUF4595 domain-containing protein [Larkinella rosea]